MIKEIFNLEKKLQIRVKNKSLLIKSLTHKSANQTDNNEKLEFVGDRVLGLVLSKKLIDLYPNENEGILDKRFAQLVNRSTCSEVAWSIDLQKYIIIADVKKKINQSDEKILSDSCEALIGAIYIDQGFDYVQKLILKLWKKYIAKSNITILDSKTKLQEYSLKNYKKLPIYNVLSSRGPKHKPTFKISVSISVSKKFIGEGSSKQEAQQDGAKKLLNNIGVI